MNVSLKNKIVLRLRQIDFAGQTFFMLIAIGFLFVIPFIGFDYGWMIVPLWAQMYLGPWQMLSCIISILTKDKLYTEKKKHFRISIVYLALLAAGFWLASEGYFPYEEKPKMLIAILVLTVPAWTLATYYYLITWRIVFTRPDWLVKTLSQ